MFLEDALPTAHAGDIRDVKTGFARNYPIPQGIAVIATTHELRRAEKLCNDGVTLIWGPGRNVSDTDADRLKTVCWFTVN